MNSTTSQTDVPPSAGEHTLARVAQLLDASTRHLTTAANDAGLASGLHNLALGVELAMSSAARLSGPAIAAEIDDGAPDDVSDLEAGVRLMREAASALDNVGAEVPGVSDLVIEIGDLLLEAGDAGRSTS